MKKPKCADDDDRNVWRALAGADMLASGRKLAFKPILGSASIE